MSKYLKFGFFIVLIVAVILIVRPRGSAEISGPTQAEAISTVSAFEAPLLEDELPTGLTMNAKTAFIRELGGEKNILAYHSNISWPIASITKLMTAVVVEETIGEDVKVTITDDALNAEGVSGNLQKGQKYSSWDLIVAMLTVSSNDSAEALAQAYDKTILTPEEFNSALSKHAYFVEKMNEKAKELGMVDTSYGDPTGVSMNNQSTAGDLYKLVIYVSGRYPDFWRVTRSKSNNILDIKSGKRQTLLNINPLSGTADFIGGKTGHTPESGDNLISIFNLNGKQYMFLVFGAQDRFVETAKLKEFLISNF